MSLPKKLPKEINSIPDLHNYLHVAMQLEHATLPPYLTALYSLKQNSNSDAYQILRVIAVEEMLHLAQSANLLVAVGGEPKLTDPDFVVNYPVYLPDGEKDFKVDQQAFSPAAVGAFLKIERPDPAASPDKKWVAATPARLAARADAGGTVLCCCESEEGDAHFYSIGDFYAEIAAGFQRLDEELGSATLFSGKHRPQVPPSSYYSGGGELVVVTDLASAQAGINRIMFQGEGKDGGKYTPQGELSHYYRFLQLKLGRYYQDEKDADDQPTGPAFNIDWFDVVPVKKNISIADFAADGDAELKKIVLKFTETYADFLATLQKAFTGQPELLQTAAVPKMFQLRNEITQIINNPLAGSVGENAAPLFKKPDSSAI